MPKASRWQDPKPHIPGERRCRRLDLHVSRLNSLRVTDKDKAADAADATRAIVIHPSIAFSSAPTISLAASKSLPSSRLNFCWAQVFLVRCDRPNKPERISHFAVAVT